MYDPLNKISITQIIGKNENKIWFGVIIAAGFNIPTMKCDNDGQFYKNSFVHFLCYEW